MSTGSGVAARSMYVIRFTALTSSCTRDDARSTSRARAARRGSPPPSIGPPRRACRSTARAPARRASRWSRPSRRATARRGRRCRGARANRRSPPRGRRARAATRRPSAESGGRSPRTRSTAASSDSLSCAAPSDARRSSASAIASPNSFAPRVAADAGLFSSCASPAATRPTRPPSRPRDRSP